MKEREEDQEPGDTVLTLAIFVALAVIILALTLVAAIAWRRHSGPARLEHPARALQQTDPTSGR
jgi:hypothetical protein